MHCRRCVTAAHHSTTQYNLETQVATADGFKYGLDARAVIAIDCSLDFIKPVNSHSKECKFGNVRNSSMSIHRASNTFHSVVTDVQGNLVCAEVSKALCSQESVHP